MKRVRLVGVTLLLALVAPLQHPSAQQGVDVVLLPTNHPKLPAEPSQFWMAPEKARGPRTAALTDFAAAVKLEVDGNYSNALPILSRLSLQDNPLAPYADYYIGLAQLRTGRPEEARRTFKTLAERGPIGFLSEAAALAEAECDEVIGDYAAAVAIYERLLTTKTPAPEDVLMRLGRAARAGGDAQKAMLAYSRVFFEFPFSDLSAAASAELEHLPNFPPLEPGSNRYKLELGRAERLFGARRYAPARAEFETVKNAARDDDRELVNLRLAECDYFLKRPRSARDGLRPYIEKASRQGEALFFYAISIRELGDHAQYLRIVRRLVDNFSNQSWAEEALNNLATNYIQQDDDDKADETFREMWAKFPSGRYAERAAWKIGWRAYKSGDYAATARTFESGAARFPRSDYRPAWLYWSGRAHEALKETPLAEARYTLAATDYLNSYYGRLALQRLNGRPERRLSADAQAPASLAAPNDPLEEAPPTAPLPPNEHVVRALLGLGLYDQAIDELRYAQKLWGDSSAIEATMALTYQKQGQAETGVRRFTLYRSAINTMKRAYPQFLAVGGEGLPKELLRVIFPVAYWDLIRKHAAERNLDPYFVAALVAQESTFVPDIKSPANAVGLMQLMASTARQYARKLGLKYSPKLLTNPETNIRIGTAYLADKIREFGDLHLVLASYNAGEHRVSRWVAERPGLDRDAFIDDIPFPETQNYVKKILGTAEDYRRLYGSEPAVAELETPGTSGVNDVKPAKAPAPKKKTPPATRRATRKST